MSQFSNTASSNSIIQVSAVPCQLTSITVYNPNSIDVWIKFQDSTDTSSAATGSTSVYKRLVPAQSQIIDQCGSGNNEDPDALWSFQFGMTYKIVTGYLHGNTTPPTTVCEVYLQVKP